MKFITKTLTLYRDLCYTTNESDNTIPTEYLWEYKSKNKNNDLNPIKDLFLVDGTFLGYAIKPSQSGIQESYSAIKTGTYLFLQGIIHDTTKDNIDLFLQASEELYLESLWLPRTIIDDKVYIRFLEEDGKNVFQIFREVEPN